jgi:stearoyl-CoA desaturase (delta-9 desaturase)
MAEASQSIEGLPSPATSGKRVAPDQLPDRPREKRQAVKIFASAAIHRLQLRHFILFDAIPAIFTLLSIALIPFWPPSRLDLTLFALLWLVTGFGLTVGFHRYFAHKSFSTTRSVELALLVAGSMAARGPMVSWVAMHRRHHQSSDRVGDLHSPKLTGRKPLRGFEGFVHAHLTWMMRHDLPNATYYVPDLLQDKLLTRVNRRYHWWVLSGIAFPTVVGGVLTGTLSGAVLALLWGGFVRLFVVEHTMSAINSICHLTGTRVFHISGDNSRNNPWLGLPSWGEAYHNNHHAFPSSAAFGLRWHQLDPGFWFIAMLRSCRLAWNVRLPNSNQIADRQISISQDSELG